MRSRVLWFLLLLIGVGLLALVLRHDAGTIAGFETGDFASLVYKIALLIFIGGAVLAMFRDRIAEAFQAAMFWVVIGLLLAVGYTYRHDLRDIGDRVLSELMPGARGVARRAVEIARGQRGEFQVVAEINGARICDGLRHRRERGGADAGSRQGCGASARLPELFGPGRDRERSHAGRSGDARPRSRSASIEERAVPALIAQPGQLRTSLLGMSFLNRLQSSEVRGDRLVLRK